MADTAISQGAGKPLSGRNVTAVLGPTNTGKTHLAIERMLGHDSGLIGLPLRLLAREVYDKIVARIGPRDVALITGEEKIKPDNPRYYVCTVEAMPRNVEVDFLAVDEIQLAADPERGHVFTERLFNARGISETLLLGAATMQDTIRELLPGANFISRPRLSKLTYAGQKKITRLPRRTAIVAFSANDVYAIAELIRRQRGGAAVVLGALSPRTRNAQVALYQSGDVDFLVATDAVGMGLNLDVDHVAFASIRKFDGKVHRTLTPGELGQIAGRAGRYMNDGTFGVTADVDPFPQDLITKLEDHNFDPLKILQWRNTTLDFASVTHLIESLRQQPNSPRLARTRTCDDLEALELVSRDETIRDMAKAPAAVRKLWDACQIPDYRKISSASHAELVATVYKFIMSDAGVIPEDWLAGQVAFADRTDGDIDTLSTRIAHIRTWTFVSHRSEWLQNPEHWQARTREIEDALSDALHEQLTQRFVDRRTSVLMKTLRDSDTLFADIESDGRIMVEKHYVGRLDGFVFTPDTSVSGVHGKAARSAATKVLASELANRAEKLSQAADTALRLDRGGRIHWSGHEIAQLEACDDPLKPGITLLCDEHLQPADKARIHLKLNAWLARYLEIRLKPLIDLGAAQDVSGLARGIAFRLRENFGVLRRDTVADEIRALDQTSRAQLRKYGVRFGAHNIYFPLLLKPAASELLALLWALKHGAEHGIDARQLPEGPRQGITSAPADPSIPEIFYRVIGFQICGGRAVRIDILERLADMIRALVSWKPTEDGATPPPGALGRGAFKATPDMMSIMGCSAEELAAVLSAIGFQRERRAIAVALPPAKPPSEKTAPGERETSPAIAEGDAPNLAEESGGATLAEAGATVAEAAEPAAEPQYEDIWRVKRGPSERRPHRPGHHRPARPQAEKAEGVPHQRPKHTDGKTARRQPQEQREGASPASHMRKPAQAPTPAGPQQPGTVERERHSRPKAKLKGKPQRPPVVVSTEKPASQGITNPDSPFAALLQLKERLERQVQDQR